ncbi:hypothetical protein SAMN04488137_3708 [Fictibacillus solisalsi]|uniref:Uncharacterized protein n=1 Tax=Fictibacillus solisalsi TaxID=459525 RepID=A0A1G9ZRK3_9BACL|nr:hypothetical protein [Fictibacillus solisalsi]SDN24029.1 hypothetical protein SAMN04488137_3708 [Fictibacillus solisalsi]
MKMLKCVSVMFALLLAGQFFSKSLVSASWAYPFVVWDHYTYSISEEYVDQVGKEIGEVTKHSDQEGEYTGNFSNQYKKGTKYFEIKGVSTDKAIAVEEPGGKYIKAIREHKYQEAGMVANFMREAEANPWISFFVLIGAAAVLIVSWRSLKSKFHIED